MKTKGLKREENEKIHVKRSGELGILEFQLETDEKEKVNVMTLYGHCVK